MSNVKEIEAAIEQLPAEQADEVASWLDSYLSRIKQQSDPILRLGESPVTCGINDASDRHDNYIFCQYMRGVSQRFVIFDQGKSNPINQESLTDSLFFYSRSC